MIRFIRIRNFKSLSDVKIELGPLTVLVGLSGTGKSNFIQAIKFLRDCLQNAQTVHHQWADMRPIPKTDQATIFDVQFVVNGVSEPFDYSVSFDSNGPMQGVLAERLQLGDRTIFEQARHSSPSGMFIGSPNRWVVEPPAVDVPSPGTVILGSLPSVSDAVIAFTALSEGIGCYTFSNNIMLDRNQQRNGQAGFDDVGANFLETMKRIVSNLQDLSARRKINEVLKRVNDSVVSIELNQLQSPSHAIVGHQFDEKTLGLDLARESEGFRRFFAHLLALYQRPPKLLLLFENPEDGIHPGALSLLAEEFSSAPAEGRGQIVLTTHSPGLLDNFDADSIRVVERKGFSTQIGPLVEEQRDSLLEELLHPGELLTVDPARMRESSHGASVE